MENYFDSINVKHWSAHNDEMKDNYAKHVICTLKTSLWNSMRKVKRYRYVNVLQDMVKSYNDMLHQTISMKPSEVIKGHVERRLVASVQVQGKLRKVQAIAKGTICFLKGESHVYISQGTDIPMGS